MIKKLIILVVLALIFFSCAIHAKFPFVCFRWSCIAAEFKLPHFDTNGMKAQRKARASMRKKKRMRAKNKRLSKKGRERYEDNVVKEQEERTQKPDSLKYRFKAQQEDRYILVSFTKKGTATADSVFVRYNEDGDDVLEYDKQLLKAYIDSNKVETIDIINVREHVGDKEEDKRHNKHSSVVKEHVAQFFVRLGVLREKIKTISR